MTQNSIVYCKEFLKFTEMEREMSYTKSFQKYFNTAEAIIRPFMGQSLHHYQMTRALHPYSGGNVHAPGHVDTLAVQSIGTVVLYTQCIYCKYDATSYISICFDREYTEILFNEEEYVLTLLTEKAQQLPFYQLPKPRLIN